jgi:pyruvate-formate lyase-activating enzyme
MPASSIPDPNPVMQMSLEELARVQNIAGKHITFSLTLACPLKCAHCIVTSGPEKGYTTMPLEVALKYAAQMPELYASGIRGLSFTGGEPLLAREQLRSLSNAGTAVGMTCGVVTAAHWAVSETAAQKTVGSFPGIQVWDVSIDSYHEPFVSFENVRRVYQTVKALGKRCSLRFTHHDPLTDDDRRIMEFVGSFAEERDLWSQRVRNEGRAKELGLHESHKYNPWTKPCITQGMVVRYDASVAPCCVNMVEERRHPFQFGDTRARPLVQIHSDYMSHSLLQLLRVVGFAEVIKWLQEAGLDEEFSRPLPDDVCDLCPRLMTNARVANYLAQRADAPENRLRIALLASRLLGEHQMLERTVEELQEKAHQIEGFELAVSLVEQNRRGCITASSALLG